MGLGPLTGVPLPFLSYGGSYTISLMIALALAQRVAIETNNETIKQEKKLKKVKKNLA
jgi:cell division protein FtsW (lipid II flippase)